MVDLSPDELHAVLNQIALGNDKGMERLYKHYQQALYAFIRHQVGFDEAAEEILLDTFMAINSKPFGFNGESNFFTWLCAIAKNKVKTWLRTTDRHQKKKIKLEEQTENLSDDPQLSWAVLDHFEKSELNQVMQGCLDKLPTSQREATYWSYYNDLRISEVALIAQCPDNTIKTRLHYARLKIRDCLERSYVGLDIERSL